MSRFWFSRRKPGGESDLEMSYEIETSIIALGGVALGSIISSVTTLLINRSERQKYKQERSWELRREAYTSILGSLDRVRAILVHMNDRYQEDPHGYDASGERAKANAQLIDFFQAARGSLHANCLMLSKDFLREYDRMSKELSEAENGNLIPPESAEIAASAVQVGVERLDNLARRELGVEV